MRYSDVFGFYELNSFPGSNQIVVSNHAFIYPEYRGKGQGQIQHANRLAMATSLGYDVIVCTVNAKNDVEKHILRKNHWHQTHCFVSTETDNGLEVWFKTLPRPL